MKHLDLTTNLAVILTMYPQSSTILRKFGLPAAG